LFSECGQVIEARIISERDTGRSRGFGFVTYSNSNEAEDAMIKMQGRQILGRVIRLDRSTPKVTKSNRFDQSTQGKQTLSRESGGYDVSYGQYSNRNRGDSHHQHDDYRARLNPPPNTNTTLDSSVCYAFQRGTCKYGSDCRYSHDLSLLQNKYIPPNTSNNYPNPSGSVIPSNYSNSYSSLPATVTSTATPTNYKQQYTGTGSHTSGYGSGAIYGTTQNQYGIHG
jgi:RNA recognition motif-containing protein